MNPDPTTRYDSLIAYYFSVADEKYSFDISVDWHLVRAQVKQESAFKPDAISSAGARGLLQLEPATWGANFEADWSNPEKNLHKGIDFLGYLWSEFKAERGLERWRFALGAYNCGLRHILDAQTLGKARGMPTDQWTTIVMVLPEVTGEDHARETIGYVRAIMSNFLAALAT